MKFLQNKVVALGIAAFFAVSISACGDDSSSGPSKQTGEDVIIDDEVPSDSVDTDDVKSSSSTKKETKVSSSSAKTEKTTSSSTKSEKVSSSSKKTEKVSSSSVSSENVKRDSVVTPFGVDYWNVDMLSKKSSSSMSSSSQRATVKESCDNPEGVSYVWLNGASVEQHCVDGYWKIVSSSSAVSSSSFDSKLQFNSEIEYGKFEDERDGKIYKTVTITDGSGELVETITFFAENLNYGTQVLSSNKKFSDQKVEKYCYDDDSWYCDNGFGGLYTWAEAMALSDACNEDLTGSTLNCFEELIDAAKGFDSDEGKTLERQGICPKGWHIINERDYAVIKGKKSGARAADKLLSKMNISNGVDKSWAGNDDIGTSILSAGLYAAKEYSGKLGFVNMTLGAYFWLVNENDGNSAKAMVVSAARNEIEEALFSKIFSMSVRCVQNRDYN